MKHFYDREIFHVPGHFNGPEPFYVPERFYNHERFYGLGAGPGYCEARGDGDGDGASPAGTFTAELCDLVRYLTLKLGPTCD
jgi:hypothetical protein